MSKITIIDDERIREEHESFGMLQIARINGGRGHLFGSSIEHGSTIRLSIHNASVDRMLNKDWYHPKSLAIIEIEMSNTQFAEAITNFNCGSGTPVTIKHINGIRTEECPHTNKRQQFQDEFEKDMRQLEQRLRKMTETTEEMLKNKPNITKADRTAILNELAMLRQEIRSNIPFVASSFNEQMSKTISEAKGEVEGFMQNKIVSLGLQELKKEYQLKPVDREDESGVIQLDSIKE